MVRRAEFFVQLEFPASTFQVIHKVLRSQRYFPLPLHCFGFRDYFISPLLHGIFHIFITPRARASANRKPPTVIEIGGVYRRQPTIDNLLTVYPKETASRVSRVDAFIRSNLAVTPTIKQTIERRSASKAAVMVTDTTRG